MDTAVVVWSLDPRTPRLIYISLFSAPGSNPAASLCPPPRPKERKTFVARSSLIGQRPLRRNLKNSKKNRARSKILGCRVTRKTFVARSSLIGQRPLRRNLKNSKKNRARSKILGCRVTSSTVDSRTARWEILGKSRRLRMMTSSWLITGERGIQ